MAYIGRAPITGQFEKQQLTADSSTTTFALDWSVGSTSAILVSVGGVLQEPETAYNLSGGGTNIVFTAAPTSGDRVYVHFLGQSITQNLTDVNGVELILDADADTSITADTDDTIDIKIAGSDLYQFTASTFTAPAGAVALTTLDIDGGTDIGAAIVDADLFVVDDGAGGTNRKVTASRLKTYAQSGLTSDSIIDADSNTKIQVEESSDENIIRFDVEGTETAIMTAKGLELGAAGGFFLNQSTNTQTVTVASDENALLVGPISFSGTVTVAGNMVII